MEFDPFGLHDETVKYYSSYPEESELLENADENFLELDQKIDRKNFGINSVANFDSNDTKQLDRKQNQMTRRTLKVNKE